MSLIVVFILSQQNENFNPNTNKIKTKLYQIMEQLVQYINTPYTIGSITFSNRLLNAAGCLCTTGDELLNLAESNSGGIITKSCTLQPRRGNECPRYYETQTLSINSTGLANEGWIFYKNFGETIKKITKKPYILSVAGIEKGDNVLIISKLYDNSNIDMIELNLSCPNIIGKPQIGYDMEATNELLRNVFESDITHPVGLKLPPYFDISHFEAITDIFKQYPITFLTCINSLGNGFVFNEKTFQASIKPKHGFGGVGGSVIKPFGLANVRKFHELLPDMPIIGCGGIQNIRDVCEYLECGASLVQIGTQLISEGPIIFDKLLKDKN
jgi:dihydroorotate dehydrogenase (fumarate)